MKENLKRTRQWLRKRDRLPSRSPGPACRILSAGLTDVGSQRRNNEDTFRCDEAAGLFLVCDGMGGMAAGEIASQIAADTTVEHFQRLSTAGQQGMTVRDRLLESIQAANGAVLEAARAPGRSGMGTTLVAAALDGGCWQIANVGDSRVYRLHDGDLGQITRDHSYLNEVERITGLPANDVPEADLLRFGALITRAIGASDSVEPDLFTVPMLPGDLLLLATDGLTRYFENPDALVPLLNSDDLHGSCEALIGAANAAGGLDNTTVLLLRCTDVM